MAAIPTHYDNLQVTRTASIEVIKAAYKGLTQRYHPDRNPNDRERCERIMKLINRAYEVLSDPDRRAEYDAFVAREEAAANEQQQKVASSEPTQRAGTTASNGAQTNSSQSNEGDVLRRVWQEVYAKFPYLNSASEQRDDAAISALLELMRQHIADGRTTASALRLASGSVGREFDLINEAEGRLGRPPLAYGFWHVSQNKVINEVTAALFARYPFLNSASKDADKIAAAAFRGLQDKYLKEGLSVGAACHRAGQEIGSRFSLLHQVRANGTATPPPLSDVSSPQVDGRWYAVPLVYLGLSLILFLWASHNPLDQDARFKGFIAVTGGLVGLFWLASAFVNSKRNRATPANNSSSQKRTTATPSSGRATASPSTERPSVWKNAGQALGALILGVYWWSRLANPTSAPMNSKPGTPPQATAATESAAPAAIASMPQSSGSEANALRPPETKRLMDEHAAQWYHSYPFINNKSPYYDRDAVLAVIARRKELTASGTDPVAALDHAISEVAPKYVEHAKAEQRRRFALHRSRLAAMYQTSENVGQSNPNGRSPTYLDQWDAEDRANDRRMAEYEAEKQQQQAQFDAYEDARRRANSTSENNTTQQVLETRTLVMPTESHGSGAGYDDKGNFYYGNRNGFIYDEQGNAWRCNAAGDCEK